MYSNLPYLLAYKYVATLCNQAICMSDFQDFKCKIVSSVLCKYDIESSDHLFYNEHDNFFSQSHDQ